MSLLNPGANQCVYKVHKPVKCVFVLVARCVCKGGRGYGRNRLKSVQRILRSREGKGGLPKSHAVHVHFPDPLSTKEETRLGEDQDSAHVHTANSGKR